MPTGDGMSELPECYVNLKKVLRTCGFAMLDIAPVRCQNLQMKLWLLEEAGEWLAGNTPGKFSTIIKTRRYYTGKSSSKELWMKGTNQNFKSIITFLMITYGFTWILWLPGVLSSYGIWPNLPWPPFFGIGTFGPLVAAVWILKKEGGWAKVKEWLKTGFQKKFGWQWWAFLVAAPFLITPLGLYFFTLTGGEIAEIPFFRAPWMLFPTFLLMVSMGGGNEEFGWRGFLLPRLLDQFNPLQADLVIIPLHAFWHIPLFFNTNTIQHTYPFWLFMAFGIGFTPLINRIFKNTSGSILAAILFHAFVNTSFDLFPPVGSWVNDSPIPLIIISGLFLLGAIVISVVTRQQKSSQTQ